MTFGFMVGYFYQYLVVTYVGYHDNGWDYGSISVFLYSIL